jgi:hypothetical protein
MDHCEPCSTAAQFTDRVTAGGHPPMVAGVAVYRGRPLAVADYRTGLLSLTRHGRWQPEMPEELTAAGRISLWHALFELHNGRIFQDWIGAAHWLVVPLGGLLLLLVIATGTIDWLRRQRRTKAARQRVSKRQGEHSDGHSLQRRGP